MQPRNHETTKDLLYQRVFFVLSCFRGCVLTAIDAEHFLDDWLRDD